jgi:hypothetical protein
MEDAITTGMILPISACGLIRRSIGHGTSENWPAQFPELASTIFATAHGRFWHETDLPKQSLHVR